MTGRVSLAKHECYSRGGSTDQGRARQTHEEKLKEINRAFSPFPLRFTLITQADGLGWDSGAPLALGFADQWGCFRPESQCG